MRKVQPNKAVDLWSQESRKKFLAITKKHLQEKSMNTPAKFQVSYDNDNEYKDFTCQSKAVEFREQCEDATIMVFDVNGNELENHGPNNEYWSIVDDEPIDDGYDFDKYY